jgi:hypothetical protein
VSHISFQNLLIALICPAMSLVASSSPKEERCGLKAHGDLARASLAGDEHRLAGLSAGPDLRADVVSGRQREFFSNAAWLRA